MTPKASIGPVTTQVMVASAVSNSPPMRWIDTARIVTVTLTENSPKRATARIAQRLLAGASEGSGSTSGTAPDGT